ncbi:hypothetical protein [Amycolatopsis nalaikhensis]|uniref:Uncharacterized protein n=1 Tax=Amycolatopsis nalaikhensis TaxID=715472 RepID=A0ABY8XYN3_9PSEU|nr:hypothetical protein [Amycolatopsis sp. 2-2]WIV60733.1 hypothetical protein QP939_20020 [Amycolatopsis sp. 2-2]
MNNDEPEPERISQFIVYAAYGEIMHKFQVLELVLWGFLARSIKDGTTLEQGMARVERWDGTTFGKLWRGLRTQTHWPDGVVVEGDHAVDARNYLAHHFLREYFLVAPSEAHRENAVAMLARIADRLDALLAQLDDHGRAQGMPDVEDLDEQARKEIEALRPTTWFTDATS